MCENVEKQGGGQAFGKRADKRQPKIFVSLCVLLKALPQAMFCALSFTSALIFVLQRFRQPY